MFSGRKHLHRGTSGNFQLVMRIPSDLQEILQAKWIKRSLKTKKSKDAEIVLNGLLAKIQTNFALIRSGMLDDEQTIAITASILPSKHKTIQKTLKQLIDLYVSERSPNWARSTNASFQNQFVNMVELLGNKFLSSYKREDFLLFRSKLKASGLQDKSVNVRMSLLSSLLKWGVRHGYLQRNQSEGMLLKNDIAPDEQRKIYDNEELQLIVARLPQSERCPWQYWIPIIAALSGMRREELSQLRRCDIVSVDGIWCFRVTADSKAGLKVKTESSSRKVPIHPYLIEKGFLDFISDKPQENNLWGFKRYNRGEYGSKFGSWYSLFNREHITKDRLKCFHSFRHTFTNHLKQIGVQETLIAELVGHTTDSITMSRYGKKFKAEVLYDVVKKIDYGF